MATSCGIYIEGVEYAVLYKHFDGYPSATLQWLEDFNAEASMAFKNDCDKAYKFATLLRSTVRDAEKYGLGDNKFGGWGIYPPDKIVVDYKYTLKKDGRVTYERCWNEY